MRQLPTITQDVLDRFWSKVARKSNTGCWLWVGAMNRCGRGMLGIGNDNYLAPRLSWAIHYGVDPYPHDVLHDCERPDNPSCVNPDHLRLGTHSENMAEAYSKNQKPSQVGMTYNRRLTPSEQDEVVRKYTADCMEITELAEYFGVETFAIKRILEQRLGKDDLRLSKYYIQPEIRAKIIARWSCGSGPTELTKEFKVGRTSVYRLIEKFLNSRS